FCIVGGREVGFGDAFRERSVQCGRLADVTKLTLNDDVATCRARVGNHAFKQRNILIHRQLRAIDDYRIYARVDGFLSFLEAVGVIGIKKYLYSLLAIQVDERARMREREKFALAFAE